MNHYLDIHPNAIDEAFDNIYDREIERRLGAQKVTVFNNGFHRGQFGNRQQALPVGRPSNWVRPIVSDCGVFNVASWNRTFPHYPVRRLS